MAIRLKRKSSLMVIEISHVVKLIDFWLTLIVLVFIVIGTKRGNGKERLLFLRVQMIIA